MTNPIRIILPTLCLTTIVAAGCAPPAQSADTAAAAESRDTGIVEQRAPGGRTAFTTSTTLATQTSNNTSASSEFTGLDNGDSAPGNVSKESIKKLLPDGFPGKVLAHWMPWWSCSKEPCDGIHTTQDDVRVHYSTEDPAQIDKVLEDMISRGYDGVMVAEANSGDVKTASTVAMSKEMWKYPSFSFSVSENHLDKIESKKQLAQLMTDMTFADDTYFKLENYLRIDGRPVVYVFDNASIDWTDAAEKAPGHPLFILDGASHASSTMGGFYWYDGDLPHGKPISSADELAKLDSFLAEVEKKDAHLFSGQAYSGFDDKYAPWTLDRHLDAACGLTFVRSVSAVGKYLGGSKLGNLPLIQTSTWDDYEEGTEVETGIDNCGSVVAQVDGKIVKPVLAFTGEGTEETVDHFEVFLSRDESDLLDAGAVAVGDSLDVGSLQLPAGTYSVYVKMVGKSHIINRMSPRATITL